MLASGGCERLGVGADPSQISNDNQIANVYQHIFASIPFQGIFLQVLNLHAGFLFP
jgi:hypothetical protein